MAYFLFCIFALCFSFSCLANFDLLKKLSIYAAKNSSFTLYTTDLSSKNSIAEISCPKNMQFIELPGNYKQGYKYLAARKVNLAGYAEDSDIVKLSLPTDRYEKFQLLLDYNNISERITTGGTFANISSGSADPLALNIYVHDTFIGATVAAKQLYAKQMYLYWQECNPDAKHLTVNFIKRSISSNDKIVAQIKDNVVVSP